MTKFSRTLSPLSFIRKRLANFLFFIPVRLEEIDVLLAASTVPSGYLLVQAASIGTEL